MNFSIKPMYDEVGIFFLDARDYNLLMRSNSKTFTMKVIISSK